MALLKMHYTKEQKLSIVKEQLETGASFAELAEKYKVHENSIRRWRKEYISLEHNAFPGRGNEKLTDEQREIARLKKELKEERLSNEILKKAMGIFASPNKTNLNS